MSASGAARRAAVVKRRGPAVLGGHRAVASATTAPPAPPSTSVRSSTCRRAPPSALSVTNDETQSPATNCSPRPTAAPIAISAPAATVIPAIRSSGAALKRRQISRTDATIGCRPYIALVRSAKGAVAPADRQAARSAATGSVNGGQLADRVDGAASRSSASDTRRMIASPAALICPVATSTVGRRKNDPERPGHVQIGGRVSSRRRSATCRPARSPCRPAPPSPGRSRARWRRRPSSPASSSSLTCIILPPSPPNPNLEAKADPGRAMREGARLDRGREYPAAPRDERSHRHSLFALRRSATAALSVARRARPPRPVAGQTVGDDPYAHARPARARVGRRRDGERSACASIRRRRARRSAASIVVNQNVFSKRDWYFQLLQHLSLDDARLHPRARAAAQARAGLRPGAGRGEHAQPPDSGRRRSSSRAGRWARPSCRASSCCCRSCRRSPGRSICCVVTRDIWSLRFNTNFEYQGNALTLFETSLSENNLFGWRKYLSVRLQLRPGQVLLRPRPTSTPTSAARA